MRLNGVQGSRWCRVQEDTLCAWVLDASTFKLPLSECKHMDNVINYLWLSFHQYNFSWVQFSWVLLACKNQSPTKISVCTEHWKIVTSKNLLNFEIIKPKFSQFYFFANGVTKPQLLAHMYYWNGCLRAHSIQRGIQRWEDITRIMASGLLLLAKNCCAEESTVKYHVLFILSLAKDEVIDVPRNIP